MCKYCKIDDFRMDFRGKRLVDEDISFGLLGNVDVVVALANERFDTTEERNADRLHIYISGCSLDDVILDKSVQINFCPICGRKLNEGKEDV